MWGFSGRHASPFNTSRFATSYCLNQLITTQEHVRGNLQPVGKPSNHFERQGPHPIEHLCDAGARSDLGLEVLSRQPAGLHHVEQKLDRVGFGDRVVPGLEGLNQQRQNFQPVRLGRSGTGIPQRLGFLQCAKVVAFANVRFLVLTV